MRPIITLAALGLGAFAVPALAQAPAAAAPSVQCSKVSKGARNALAALQVAVAAKNTAAIPVLLRVAQASAKNNDDRCFIGIMQYKAAAATNDYRGMAAGLEAQLASGLVPAAIIAAEFENVGRSQYNAQDFAGSGASFERAIQIAPGRGSSIVMLAETRTKQKRVAEALPLYQRALATEIAAGRKPEENWYKRSVAVAYEARSPLAFGLTRDWVRAYPSPRNWRDSLTIYGELSGLDDAALIDVFRLARLNRALVGDSDYYRYVQAATARGFSGEAKAVLEEGFAANAIDRNKPLFKTAYAAATAKSAGDRASLESQLRVAEAGTAARPLMAVGDAYFGYGDYAKAAAAYRKTLTKSGVDTSLANLRLGMALAASGDKAGATAALNLVTGPRAEIAKYWLTWLATRP